MVTEYDKRVIGDYFLKEGMEKGLQQGMEKGMEKGLAKGRAEEHQKLLAAAKAMLADGLSYELISKYTGLTKEQIDALK